MDVRDHGTGAENVRFGRAPVVKAMDIWGREDKGKDKDKADLVAEESVKGVSCC